MLLPQSPDFNVPLSLVILAIWEWHYSLSTLHKTEKAPNTDSSECEPKCSSVGENQFPVREPQCSNGGNKFSVVNLSGTTNFTTSALNFLTFFPSLALLLFCIDTLLYVQVFQIEINDSTTGFYMILDT